jgi:hypothetical protein
MTVNLQEEEEEEEEGKRSQSCSGTHSTPRQQQNKNRENQIEKEGAQKVGNMEGKERGGSLLFLCLLLLVLFFPYNI